MEIIKVDELAAIVSSVAAYARQIATIFHNYSLIAKTIPRDFVGITNLLDASAATLKQLHALLHPIGETQGGHQFNEQGLKYVQLLLLEIAKLLSKFEPAIEEACLGRQDRKKLQKQKRKAKTKNIDTILDPLTLSIDEKEFLEKSEKTNWDMAIDDLSEHVPRLYELQLLVLLVFQVGSVAKLSKDVSSGKVDVQRIVSCNERIVRTANLVGIKVPSKKSKSYSRYGRRRSSFSDSDTFDSDTDFSDSSFSSLDSRPRRMRRKAKYAAPPPPPPPPPPLRSTFAVPLSSVPIPIEPIPYPPSPKPAPEITSAAGSIRTANPPAYFENSKEKTSTKDSPTAVRPCSLVPEQQVYPQEKVIQDNVIVEKQAPVDPKTPDSQIFTAKFNTIGSRFKSFFRSKSSLAEEMRRILLDSDSQLTGFVLQKRLVKPIPHSTLHSIESTHLKTILAHNTWYGTYKTLDSLERSTLHQLLHPTLEVPRQRELVSLEILQENKVNAWLSLCADILRGPSATPRPPSTVPSGRLILVICREKLVEGKPIQDYFASGGLLPAALPRPLGVQLAGPPKIPGTTSVPYSSRISDLSTPAPALPHPIATLIQPYGPSVPDPKARGIPPPPPPVPSIGRTTSIKYSDITPPLDNVHCKEMLITFREFTLRLCDRVTPDKPPNWSRVAISQESSARHLVEEHVLQYESAGNNVIEAKVRLTGPQSGQITRIMDDIRRQDSDLRFEWCWVEISLHDDTGNPIQLARWTPTNVSGGPVDASHAGRMYVVAKRTLRPQYRPLDVYHSLLRGEPVPIVGPGPLPAPGAALPHPIPRGAPGPSPPCLPPTITPPKPYITLQSDPYYSSDSSFSGVRRRMRRIKARKPSLTKRYDSSDTESEEEENDIVQLKLELKRGDSVVQKLLDMWTSTGQV